LVVTGGGIYISFRLSVCSATPMAGFNSAACAHELVDYPASAMGLQHTPCGRLRKFWPDYFSHRRPHRAMNVGRAPSAHESPCWSQRRHGGQEDQSAMVHGLVPQLQC
jgi:hypothetical protein